MVSALRLVAAGEHEDALAVAELHKAVGWVLREVGKRVDTEILRRFLKKHAGHMPRTALRYAIEHFEPAERKRWLTA